MKQIILEGYYSEKTAKKIVEKLNHRSYIEWELTYSNCNGNCSIIITYNKEFEEREVLEMFYYVALQELTK